MSLCEWDPERSVPAEHIPGQRNSYKGCLNAATLTVGANGQWHLCESCASLRGNGWTNWSARRSHDEDWPIV